MILHIIKKSVVDIINLLKFFLPKGRNECTLLFSLFFLYFSYSLILIFKTSIIDNHTIISDIYFSFDNPSIFKRGTLYSQAHPLLKHFLLPLTFIGNFLASIITYKAKTILFVIVINIMISLSSVYIYRYLKEIVALKGNILYLLVLFYSFTSTNLILSFTPESYPITLFLMTFLVYYYSHKIREDKSVDFLSSCILAIGLGGVTITNFAKGIIPVLFLKDNPSLKIKKIVFSGLVFSIPIMYMLLKVNFFNVVSFTLYMNDVNNATNLPVSELRLILNFFFAAAILFPNLIMENVSLTDIPLNAISLDYFKYWWQIVLICLVYVFTLVSVLYNYKNKYVWMLLLLFLVDIVIHFIVKFGLRDLFIYSGHWVFIIPLLLGWLYVSIKSARLKKAYFIILSFVIIAIIINNFWRLFEFISLAIKNYPEF